MQAGLLIILTRSQLSQKSGTGAPVPAALPPGRPVWQPRCSRSQSCAFAGSPARSDGGTRRERAAARSGAPAGPARRRRRLPPHSAGAGTGRPRRVPHSSPQLFTSSAPRAALPPSPHPPKTLLGPGPAHSGGTAGPTAAP